jgi:predicted nucleotidyltransferase
MNSRQNRAVRELRRRVERAFPGNLQKLLVFGSVARGTDGPDSDIDVLVVLDHTDVPQTWRLEKKLRDIAFPVELEHDVVFDLKLALKEDLLHVKGHTPFMENVFGEGVTV